MASEKSSPENTIERATFAPFFTIWNLAVSTTLILALSLCVQLAWVHYQNLDPDTYFPALVGYYVENSPRRDLAESVALNAYQFVFLRSSQKLQDLTPDGASNSKVGKLLERGFQSTAQIELHIVGWSMILFATRLVLVGFTLPFFLLLMVVGFVDGVVQRYHRKSCGGHESAAMYHRAKRWGFRLLPPFAGVIYLCSPVAFEPAWLFVPVGIISALLLRLQATYYKKYL